MYSWFSAGKAQSSCSDWWTQVMLIYAVYVQVLKTSVSITTSEGFLVPSHDNSLKKW